MRKQTYKYWNYSCVEYIRSFKHESKRNAMELSNFAQEDKHTNTETNLVWNILDKDGHIDHKPKDAYCV